MKENSFARAGLEWCVSLAPDIDKNWDRIKLLEIIPENFFPQLGNTSYKDLFRKIEQYNIPVIIHSIGLSLASIEPFKQKYFDQIKEIVDQCPNVVQISDHLCLTEMAHSEIGQLTPTPYTYETLKAIVRKIKTIQKQVSIPFAIENITASFQIPNQEIEETKFIELLQQETDALLLLDLNNIYTNGVNFGIDPYEWLDHIHLEQVGSIHLAGGFYDENGILQDGHCAKVPHEVWKLFQYTIRKAGRKIPTIVERTARNKPYGLKPVLEDQEKAQSIMDKELPQKMAS